ncbi:MAG: class I tRNA ligase family protein, partial [Bacilli bacterium]|nr:class I tRNA ligase family protein [Bacilli bacterium]
MLDKHYDPHKVEEGKYEKWKEEGYFQAGRDLSKQPFSMVIPPPNVTGKLHLGHAMDTTIEDIIARYKREAGYDVLWVPGMDHAGIATQAKVEEKLRGQGISRFDLGREGFLKKAWEWKHEYADTIHSQWAKMGLSVDYTRERFTLDEGLSAAVRHVFVTLYKEGLIYQGEKIINWDPELRTALSNIEVIHKDDEGEFYYFKYDVVGTDKSLIVATTRPETMFGDTAVFVNPKDKKYADLVGKMVVNPANGEEIPLMADEYVDISFGTGAMKCTPAHDPNDFLLGKKYGFKFIKCIDETAHMNEIAGPYKGMSRYECRKALVDKIKEEGHLVKIEKIVHSVGHSERSDSVVEPMLSKQWFVKMKPLAEKVLATQKGSDKVNFVPKR